jgi:penicillin-insensitive murein endopeptidase
MVGRPFAGTLVTVCALAALVVPGTGHGRTRAKRSAPTVASASWSDLPAPSRPLRGGVTGHLTPFATQAAIWRVQRTPAPGPARVFGRTTSGCLAGAIALPVRGEGFVRRNPRRPTGFGHPDLVAYVKRLGEAARHAGLGGLLVGDMSLPRGGLYLQGHASHQTGLDVDIGFRTSSDVAEDHASGGSRPSPASTLVLPQAGRHLVTLLRLAAADERVDRIFVAAKIKRRLCRTVVGDRRFLEVLRPWTGHEHHFHVRLKCPVDSPGCRPNEPITSIPDDCEALLHWWRTANVASAFAEWRASERATYVRDLPSTCQMLAGPAERASPPERALAAQRPTELPGQAH